MPQIKSFEQKIIYIYKHFDVASHKGWLKVGETTRDAGSRVRIQNEADNVKAEILWEIEAIRNNGRTFSDKDIHRLLDTKGIEREKKHNTKTNRDSEWFKIDLDSLKKYVEDYKNCIVENEKGEIVDFVLRKEQQEAIDITKAYWQDCEKDGNLQPEFLWNAKPRFGKTLTAYEFAKDINAKKILIVTNRPAISDSWFKDYKKFIKPNTDYIFTSSESISKNDKEILTRDDVFKQNLTGKPFIHFISLQDIKGQGEDFASWKKKNDWIFEFDKKHSWDLLIIDESHEGVDTSKTDKMLTNLNRKFTLHLSGTPFKAIANQKFNSKQIFNWSYTDEQNAKANWSILDGENPYAALPKLNIFTYQLSRALQITTEQARDEGSEYAFDLGEFFKVTSGKFAYENEIIKFLDNLCNPEFEYPFSKAEYLESLRHTFWLLPGVEHSKQMKKLLTEHRFFKDYEIILAAGNGDEDRIAKTALQEVREKIGKHPLKTKTITLSCRQLTTGVTVPAWTAVIMLNNCKSPSLYMQSAFRSQNPFEVEGKVKTDCYVFDFAPDRILQIFAEFADNLNNKNAIESREEKIKTLLNFLPVISEDDEGKMKELNASEVLSIPLKLITAEVVNRGFMSNRLFDNIAGIFGASKEILEIVNKLKPEENKKFGDSGKNQVQAKPKIWLDNEDKIHIGEDIVVNTTNGLLGDKKYVLIGSEEEKQVSQILADTKTEMENKGYPPDAQKEILNTLEQKLPVIKEYEPSDKGASLPDPEPPDNQPKKGEKTEEEKVRDRLRGFTRTIPSFLMAYGNENTKLENFEKSIPCEVFKDLTSITIEEFVKLREANLFNKDIFNESVKVFLRKKADLADYFNDSNEDIFDYIPPQETNQIFTPKKVVVDIVDMLYESHPDIFANPETKFCDLYVKSGLFLTEVAKRLYVGLEKQIENKEQRIKHILENQIYGYVPTEILYKICTNFIGSSKNICLKDTIPFCKNKTLPKELNMKFDVIIGNPPYQENDTKGEGFNKDSSTPLYHLFFEIAQEFSQYQLMIMPAKWARGGKNLDDFRKKIINDSCIEKIVDFPDDKEIFPNNNNDGGIMIMLRNSSYNGETQYTISNEGKAKTIKRKLDPLDIGYIIRNTEDLSIVKNCKSKNNFSNIVSSQKPYGFRSDVFNTKEKYIHSTYQKGDYTLHGGEGYKGGTKRVVGYISPSEYKITQNAEEINKWKLFFSKAYSIDATVPPEIIVAGPNIICTEMYLRIGAFDTKIECENCLKYIKTKFFRHLLQIRRFGLNMSQKIFSSIPLQDFTSKSDIDWTKPIAQINKQLYDKYKLDKNEREWIEGKIKEME